MSYVCDNHRSKTALWICADCDGLYCSECVEKRIISQRGNKKTFYFCPKCNLEVERLSSFNPFRGLWEILDKFFRRPPGHTVKKDKSHKLGGGDTSLSSRIDKLIRDGDIDDAITLMQGERDSVSSDINLSERYYNILKQKDNSSEILEHGRAYLDLLAKGRSREKLCEVYRECVSMSPDFSASSFATFKIAGSMIESGNPKGAAEVYQGFIKNNPDDPMFPKASFLAASIFNERLLDPDKAAEILQDLLRRYPDHEVGPNARQYLGQIRR